MALSIGLLLLGIDIIRRTSSGVELGEDMTLLIGMAEHHPLAMAVAAAIVSVLMQSSTATIGLIIGLGMADARLLPLKAAVAAVVGANVGIAVTTLLVGWGQIDSRRLALGNLATKAAVAALVLAFVGSVVALLEQVPAQLDRRVALTHTCFNLAVAMIGLPLVGLIHDALSRVIPTPAIDEADVFGPKYVTGKPPDSVPVALGQCMREIMRVTEIVRGMLKDVWQALTRNDAELAMRVRQRDDDVDLLDTHIKRYLIGLTQMADDPADLGQHMLQLRYLNEMETIGDLIDKNLSELVVKKARIGSCFSTEGMDELDEFYRLVAGNLLTIDTAFATRDHALASQVLDQKPRTKELEEQLRDRHFARLTSGLDQSYRTSSVHLDILACLKTVNSHVSHAAAAILAAPASNGG